MIKVLIVEDDPMVLEINKGYLNEIPGYEVIGAVSSVKEAVHFLQSHKPNLILLDIFMPEENGLNMLTTLRQKEFEMDVILITAASDVKSINKAIQYGAFDYIIKPFSFDRFKQSMLKYKQQARILKEENELNQNELDRLLAERRHLAAEAELPKGLTKYTLKEIWKYVEGKEGAEFTTDELVEETGISRISVRKYLQFLEKASVLTSHCSYGNIGRPLTVYQCMDDAKEYVKPYLSS